MQLLVNERLIFVARVTCCVQHMNTEKIAIRTSKGPVSKLLKLFLPLPGTSKTRTARTSRTTWTTTTPRTRWRAPLGHAALWMKCKCKVSFDKKSAACWPNVCHMWTKCSDKFGQILTNLIKSDRCLQTLVTSQGRQGIFLSPFLCVERVSLVDAVRSENVVRCHS